MESEAETKVLPAGPTDAKPLAPVAIDPIAKRHRVGRYELLQRLGHGGMATVYLGRATGSAGFEKLVALKVIHSHLAAEPEFVAMFLEEARIAAKIQSPHVAAILDLGHDDGVHYMVMEYIAGETVSALLRELRPTGKILPPSLAVQLMVDACQGLSAVHELRDPDGVPYGLVHRDMSPQNLMLGFDGWLRLVDFGLVKATGANNTHTGRLRGKLAYMSPEQARGQPIAATTDIFALGVVFWELLTGKRLFAGATDAETIDRVFRCEVPPLTEFRTDLPPEIEEIIHRALARDPARRYAAADEMLHDLRRCLLGLLGRDDDPRRQLAALMREHFGEPGKNRGTATRDASRSSSRPHIHLVPRPVSGPFEATAPRSAANLAVVAAASEFESHTPAVKFSEPTSGVAISGRVDEVLSSSGRSSLSLGQAPALAWWLGLPLLGAAVMAIILVITLRALSPAIETPLVATPEVVPADAEKPAPVVPQKVVWNFESEPPGAQVTLAGLPAEVAPEIQHQLADLRTPFSLEIPKDERLRIEVEFSQPGYKDARRSLLALGNENINVRLHPDPPPPSAVTGLIRETPPITTLTSPRRNKPRPDPRKTPEPKQEPRASSELKVEPTFDHPRDGHASR